MTKRILVLHTGGTISMQADTTGKVITNEHNPMNHVAVPLEGIQVTALDVFNIPSPHITPQHMLQLYQKSRQMGSILTGLSLLMERTLWKKQLIFWIPWNFQIFLSS